MIKNETIPTIVDNLYSLASHHIETSVKSKAVSTIGATQVQTQKAVVPIENEKGTLINIKT
tara:strand:- start:1589 stop:1771 length:183 start_codon:yes stop_codon:yes gene_type:complete